jgi:hypothetical protein
MSADLLRRCAAARLCRLRRDPQDPAGFLAKRDELAHLVETDTRGRCLSEGDRDDPRPC